MIEPNYRHRKRPWSLIFIIVFALIVLAIVFKPKTLFVKFEQGVLYIVKPPYKLTRSIILWVKHSIASLGEIPKLKKDISALKNENQALKNRIMELEIKKEYRIDPHLIPARVLSYSISSWDKIIILDAGAKQGVEKWMGVITPEGVVGIVIDVAPGVSKVIRIDDRNSEIGATLLNNSNVKGIAQGFDNNLLSLDYIPNVIKVQEGDTVITAGGSSVFPKGLIIGNVIKIEKYEYKTYQDVLIKTKVDLNKLDKVYIVASKELKDSRKLLGYENK